MFTYEVICEKPGADISIYQATDFKLTPDGYVLYNANTGATTVVEDVIGLIIRSAK